MKYCDIETILYCALRKEKKYKTCTTLTFNITRPYLDQFIVTTEQNVFQLLATIVATVI